MAFDTYGSSFVRVVLASMCRQPRHSVPALLKWVAMGFLVATTPLMAQSAIDAFNPGANDRVQSLELQTDGKVLVGGAFSRLGGATRNGIGRVNPNGTLDTGFDPNVGGGSVYSLAVQPDGKVLIGGNFTRVGGVIRNGLARVNPDGSLDTGFNPNVGAGNFVYSLVLQPDGKVLVGGDFTQLGGVAIDNLGRLNPNGSLDTGFTIRSNAPVLSLLLQADGSVLVGGAFTQIGAIARNRIARIKPDGSLDTAFNPDANGNVHSFAVSPNGKIYAGGDFTQMGGVARTRIARLNPAGGLDGSFTLAADNTVSSLALQPDGRLLVGGAFTQLGGNAQAYIARLNLDDSVESGFNPAPNGAVLSLRIQMDGKALLGGYLTQIGTTPRLYIGRLTTDGSLDTDFKPVTNGPIYGLALQADGKILASGPYTTIGGAARNNIARLYPDGRVDPSFTPIAYGTTFGVAVQADGKILVTGGNVAGSPTGKLSRLNPDGTLDESFIARMSDTTVNAIATQPDGKVLTAGSSGVTRLNLDGSVDSSFARSIQQSTTAVAVQPDGKVLASVSTAVRRLNADGSVDDSFFSGVAFGGTGAIRVLVAQNDGKVLVVGDYQNIDGIARSGIARLNTDGTLDSAFVSHIIAPGRAISPTNLILLQNGQMLIGGQFSLTSELPRYNGVVRINPDGSIDPDFGIYNGYYTYGIAAQSDGKILVGGDGVAYTASDPLTGAVRLALPEPALQVLNVSTDGSSVEWLRDGSSVALRHVTFEQSIDGQTWTMLGAGNPIAGGWSLTGFALPHGQDVWVRGRGQAIGGFRNSSASYYESVRQIYMTARADLSIQALPDQATLYPGGPIHFSLTVRNDGPNDVASAQVQWTVPAGLVNVAWTCGSTPPAACMPGGTGAIADVINLPAGAALTYDITAVLTSNPPLQIINSAEVILADGYVDPDSANNVQTWTQTVDGIFRNGMEL